MCYRDLKQVCLEDFPLSLSVIIEFLKRVRARAAALENIFLRNYSRQVTTFLNNDSNIYSIKAILCFIWNSGAFIFLSSHNMTLITDIKMLYRRYQSKSRCCFFSFLCTPTPALLCALHHCIVYFKSASKMQ